MLLVKSDNCLQSAGLSAGSATLIQTPIRGGEIPPYFRLSRKFWREIVAS
jgi:hypothetical protein